MSALGESNGFTRAGLSRRTVLLAGPVAALGFTYLPTALAGPGAPAVQLDPKQFQGILDAGKWTDHADDNASGEALPAALASALVGSVPARAALSPHTAPDALGLLVLTLSVAEWGMAWNGSANAADPAGTAWNGPSRTGGKHLMSYALGGIGLAHLDSGDAVKFFRELITLVPQSSADLMGFAETPGGFRYDIVRSQGGVCAAHPSQAVIMTDLDGKPFEHDLVTYGGKKYCHRFDSSDVQNAKAWQVLRHWCRVGLRRRDMQAWIMRNWLDHVWSPAYQAVLAHPHGTLEEAFVIARAWSSSETWGRQALAAAGSETDAKNRISLELAHYGSLGQTYKDRLGLMQRPGAVYNLMAKA